MNHIKLTVLGDIMLKKEMINSSNNYDNIFKNIKSYLDESDFVIGNLEMAITNVESEIKVEKYSFSCPMEFARAVKNAGIDLVSTANNHCLDNGIKGIKRTINCLDEIKLKHVGTTYGREKLFIENINGVKIGVLACTYGTNAFANEVYLDKNDYKTNISMLQQQELSNYWIRKLYTDKKLYIKVLRKICKVLGLFQFKTPIHERYEKSKQQKKQIVKNIKEMRALGVDYIIMLMHEGGQNNLKPIRKTIENAKFMNRNGVNIVVGNHEHVIHKIERINNDIITYSIGNFTGTTGILEEPYDRMSEYSIGLNIYINKNDLSLRYTFSIFKNVLDKNDGQIKVNLLYDLINKCDSKEAETLKKDNQKIVEIVTGKKNDLSKIMREYEL